MMRPAGVGGIGVLARRADRHVLRRRSDAAAHGGGGIVATDSAPSGPNAIDDENEQFVAVVLGQTEDVWGRLFQESNLQYTNPKLVLFTGVTGSACGTAQSAMGPFYCPNDQTVYLDMDFFRVMEQQLGSRGEFARAYVIAHEVGHHVQDELGVLSQVNAQRGADRRARLERALGAGRAAGRLLRRHLGERLAGPTCSSPTRTSRARSTPPRASATTRSSARARAGWCRTASRTAPASSGRSGSTAATGRAIPTSATASRRGSEAMAEVVNLRTRPQAAPRAPKRGPRDRGGGAERREPRPRPGVGTREAERERRASRGTGGPAARTAGEAA